MRPMIPPVPDFSDPGAVQAWNDAKRAAFVWDAVQAGFTTAQAVFMYQAVSAAGIAIPA